MKKLILLLFVLPLVFISCSDDKDENEVINSLDGTVWVYMSVEEYGFDEWTLTFEKTTFKIVYYYEEEYDKGEIISDSGTYAEGIYTYNHPTLILEYEGQREEVKVNGNQIKIIPEDYDGEELLFIKKK